MAAMFRYALTVTTALAITSSSSHNLIGRTAGTPMAIEEKYLQDLVPQTFGDDLHPSRFLENYDPQEASYHHPSHGKKDYHHYHPKPVFCKLGYLTCKEKLVQLIQAIDFWQDRARDFDQRLSQHLEDNAEEIQELYEQLSEVNEDIVSTATELADVLGPQVVQLARDAKVLGHNLKLLKSDSERDWKAFEALKEGIHQRVIDWMDAENGPLAKVKSSLEQQVSALEQDRTTLRVEINEVQMKSDNIQAKVVELQAKIRSNDQKLGTLKSDLAGNVTEANSQLSKAGQELIRHEAQDYAKQSATMDKFRSDLQALRHQLTQARHQVDMYQSTLDTKQLKYAKDDIVVGRNKWLANKLLEDLTKMETNLGVVEVKIKTLPGKVVALDDKVGTAFLGMRDTVQAKIEKLFSVSQQLGTCLTKKKKTEKSQIAEKLGDINSTLTAIFVALGKNQEESCATYAANCKSFSLAFIKVSNCEAEAMQKICK